MESCREGDSKWLNIDAHHTIQIFWQCSMCYNSDCVHWLKIKTFIVSCSCDNSVNKSCCFTTMCWRWTSTPLTCDWAGNERKEAAMEGCQPERRDGGKERALMQMKETAVTDWADRREEEGGETEASRKAEAGNPAGDPSMSASSTAGSDAQPGEWWHSYCYARAANLFPQGGTGNSNIQHCLSRFTKQ